MLEVKNLSKQYGEKVVVDNLNFAINEPGVYALLGTNGAGRTAARYFGMASRLPQQR